MRGQPPNFGFSGAGWGQPQPQQQQQPPPLQQQLLRQPQPQPQFPAAQYMSPNVELQMLNHGRQTSVGFVPGHHNVNFPMQNSNLPIQNYGFQFPQPRNPGFYFQQPPIPNPSLNFSQLPNPGFNNPQPPPYMGSLPHYSTKNPAEGTTRADNSVAKACWTKKPVEGTTRTDNAVAKASSTKKPTEGTTGMDNAVAKASSTKKPTEGTTGMDNAVAKASSTKKPTEGTTGMDNAVAKASSTKKPTEGTTGMDNAVAKVSLAKNPAEGTTRTDNAVAKASSAKNPEEGTTGTENAVAKASSTKREDIMRINNAVAKAHNDLLVTKENITAWKVLQSALSILQVDSWDSFGFRLQQIDALHRLMLIEGKINSFIHCFVGVRRIATLYELEMAICKNEGVKQFEELRLGPFLCHPLVLHYFSLSSEVTEVFNIKNEEIVSFLSEFMDADVCKNKNITVEDFLDFISRKRSVTNREMLGIRVQNLGMHVSIIRKARKSEDDILSKFLKKSDEKRRKRPLFKLHKQQLDERFSAISQRVESFSSSQKDFCGKHVRFGSSSEDEDSDDNTCENKKNAHDSSSVLKLSLQSNKSSDHDSGCPYPSATEEMTRLGLKGEVTGHTTPVGGQKHTIGSGTSKRKRKSRDENHTTFGSSTLGKKVKVEANILDKDSFDNSHEGSDDEAEYKITNNSLRIFITTWKDGCRDMNVDEVLKRMLDHYSIKYQSTIRVRSMLSSYPFIGLLNVAVSSIRNGMWDSIYDSLQTINLHELTNTHVAKQPVYECIDVGPSAEGALIQHVPKSTYGITVEDILNKVGQHVKFEQEIHSSSRIVMENRIRILKQLCSCEFWLVEQFSAKDFKSLGHGDFFTFLQKHASMLPHELCKFLMPEISERPPLEACMLQHQLVNLVSQACNNLSENEILSKQLICALLTQQFPLISFKLTENGSFENFMELVGQQKNNVVSKCVTFSVTLLGRCQSRDSLASPKNDLSGVTLVTDELGQRMRAFGSATSEDATKVLIRAPMLLDLNLWSHWDTLFAPTLGPLVPWLQNEVNIEFFLCLVTKEGKVIRIDHTATADSFLDAALQGSPFRTAVKLLSIFALLGGEKHVPISLLKHHANRAFEVIIKNSVDNVDMFDNWAKGHGKAHQNFLEQVAADNMNCELKNKIVTRNKAIPILSRFFVDCLGYLPAEFRFLAADILLSGISSSIKDATSGILHECHKPEHRLMLHEIGLSLGVVEWIQDHHTFSSSASSDLFTDESACLNDRSDINRNLHIGGLLTKHSAIEQNASFPNEENMCKELATSTNFTTKTCNDSKSLSCVSLASEPGGNKDAAEFVQSIRHDEFGLDPGLSNSETGMLRKQHARLGRALHCLSQELYSQDSHFLLELVQNADDNIYPRSVEPTLAFIFEDSGIVVLNNEEGFSAQNIKALCDVGNSTKKGSNAGYIGKKGIGFKSVFRVTDAPEIHSNGFHIKFDISEGQIGFVLPTIISPCNINLYGNLASNTSDQQDTNIWNTCIVLPFRSKLSGGNLINNIVNMFADLHPSLLLFLHRLQCIKIRNLLDNSLIVMRKEIVGNGIIKVSHGEDKMTWLVVSQRLKADVIRHDVQSTEISIAFTLQEEENGVYSPFLDQQQVFAFLPLRMYGLKFIIQGDFVLPSSREEVDGDNPWNQWLLSEFPDLFVSAVKSFCYLPCFKSCSGKAIAAYMSYVPLIGEVHGFFSSLPRLIISKLRMSNCLLLEGKESESVPPCKVLRGWNEQALTLLPDTLLHEHLGLGFLDKDVILSDSLARALGIEEYGPKILVQFISSLCQKHNSLKSMGLVWLGSCLDALHNMLVQSSVQTALELERNVDLIRSLQKVPLIPLSDGTYSSVAEGTIWLHSDSSNTTVDGKYGLEAFPNLNAKIRVICPAFLSLFSIDNSHMDAPSLGNISRMLHRIGVQRLSAHEIIKVHVIPAISNESNLNGNKILMTEYVCFVMTHLLSSCPECQVEKGFIVSELRNKALILTNHGYKRPVEVPVHFSKDYGNPIDVDKIINVKVNWHEVDDTYMKHPVTHSLPSGLTKWRNFFQEIGITDFVHVVEVNRSIADMPRTIMTNRMWDPDLISSSSVVKDWESPELSHLLTLLSVHGNQESCKYLLEVLDTLWDDHLSDKVVGCCISKSDDSSKQFQSAFMNSICDVQWVVSSVDDKLHYPKDLYYDCDAVHSILGTSAPYAVPKVRSTKLVRDIGFKTSVTLDDALDILKVWRTEKPFKTSISQMCTFYTFLWNEMSASKQKIMEEFHSGPFIFIPIVADSRHEDVVSGVFLSPNEVYWSDPIGSIDKIKDVYLQCSRSNMVDSPIIKTLCNIYPGLKKFFIGECGIHEYPPLCSYLQILKQISEVAFPSQASDIVFQVYLKWADGLKSGLLSSENVAYLKECIGSSEFMVLPTELDKWVSLHPSTRIVCCCDDERLRQQCKNMGKIDFVYFGEINNDRTEAFQEKITHLLKALGVPLLSEIVTREAKYYGLRDSSFKTSLMNWALPFAQRYMYSVHLERYAKLKQSGFDILSRLRVIVVEKLFFSNVIKNFGLASDEQVPCSCLLQDNILYTTQDSDSHSLFMEFSRLLFNGTPELHLANFLHMITTMAESGATKEQTEFFILNTQKVTKLPEEEPVWSLSSVTSLVKTPNLLQTSQSPTLPNVQGSSSMAKKNSENWPPADWKTAPGFRYAQENGFKTQPASSPPDCNLIDNQSGNLAPIPTVTDWTYGGDSSSMSVASVVYGTGDYVGQHINHSDVDPEAIGSQSDSPGISWRTQLRTGTPNPAQAMAIGRLGEQVAFKYFAEKFSNTLVKWVNEDMETGFPFDIIIGEDEDSRQYIEVKSTRSARKDWFDISLREWQFAVEKGELFSIAHVLLLANNVARVTVFQNPVKSCQSSKLQLALLMPKQQIELSPP